MPLWLDMLRTPMAAPETRGLKAMRLTILGNCVILALSIAAVRPLNAAIGNLAGLIPLAALLTLLVTVPVYLARKNHADAAHLDALCAGESACTGDPT